MLVDVCLSVLNGNGPLLIPPIWLSKHAAIHHCEPIVAPKIDVNFGPVAVVLDLLRIEHQRAVNSSAGDVRLQPDFLDDGAIAFGEFLAKLAHVIVVGASEDFAKSGKAGGHRHAVRVVGSAVKNLV